MNDAQQSTGENFLETALKQFRYYKQLGENAMRQLPEAELISPPDAENNSVAVLVKHLHGNMRSRWTDFLSTDGEKPWRNRDTEFEHSLNSAQEVFAAWESGWALVFQAVEPLAEHDLNRIVYLRNQGHTVLEAITRQLCHYSYHVGQLVYICKAHLGENWQSLSIPKGGSEAYNAEKFARHKQRKHFTDD